MILFESRASIILFNVLSSLKSKGTFLLPLNICPIVPITFIKAKTKFEFIDIQLNNLCIDQEKVMERIRRGGISGILFAHTFGVELNVEDFFKNIKEFNSNIFIIDDKCLNIPDFNVDIELSNADLMIYSTGYVKYVDLNWGGYGFLKDKYLYFQKQLIFKENDLDELLKDLEESILNNSNFNYKDSHWLGSLKKEYKSFKEYKAVILERLPNIIIHKNNLNKIYRTNIPREIHLGQKYENWRFSILVENKNKFLEEIFKRNLFASSHYKEVDYLFSNILTKKSNCKKISSSILNLFNDFRFTEEMAFEVSQIIKEGVK